ncbi:hypothetical protein GCM10014715_59200 [Streptomyces spiralis]|uniref:Uncharacterized protein n=1 Tax=Streptomyces spiralis TaxID=66376 RepID=A0A919A9C7_9ACTN|nr:SDR family NAD(P)-dependent oxidoreductase [Streptomyces spiralis]GHE95131.1 hypothetical protein GCM10014715_59200 [Streptomyces spiralis]
MAVIYWNSAWQKLRSPQFRSGLYLAQWVHTYSQVRDRLPYRRQFAVPGFVRRHAGNLTDRDGRLWRAVAACVIAAEIALPPALSTADGQQVYGCILSSMELNLTTKRALVTGSSAGLGEATAKLLAAEGAAVVIHGRDKDRAQKVAQEIRDAGGTATVALGDLATDEGAAEVVRAATADGPVDILVNNAGFYRHLSWAEAAPDEWNDTYNINVVSGVRMIQQLVPAMRERGWGRVITIGGGLASQPMNTHPQYNATLAARHNLAVSLARDLKDTGVTSNVVSPGAILVEATKDLVTSIGPARGWGDTWEEIQPNAVQALIPNDHSRFGKPDEIAAAVAYLCSDYAEYISGATIRVDGGLIRSAF